ncbi:MAG: calcium/sodium antiporter [Gemmatimonadetes bacterium]|nr:calcium/sodium antiporter [Gemmatimonadota bacterium]
MYLSAGIGFVLLFGGGELLVKGAVAVAKRFGLSPLLIGMTIVAFCTSAPELVVSVNAALAGSSDIALGNVVGSNVFNVLGVLGITALVAPITVNPPSLRRDTYVLIGASVALALLAQAATIGATVGVVFIAGIIAYVVLSYRAELQHPGSPEADLHGREADEVSAPSSLWAGLAYLAVGLSLLIVGSRFLLAGAIEVARAYGMSEAVIGLTLVAVGTSLPELATSVMAAFRGHSDVAVGNVVGSGIFNILSIIGVTAVLRPITVAAQMATVDVWVSVAVAVLLVPFLLRRGHIGRAAGAWFTGLYVVYTLVLLRGPSATG